MIQEWRWRSCWPSWSPAECGWWGEGAARGTSRATPTETTWSTACICNRLCTVNKVSYFYVDLALFQESVLHEYFATKFIFAMGSGKFWGFISEVSINVYTQLCLLRVSSGFCRKFDIQQNHHWLRIGWDGRKHESCIRWHGTLLLDKLVEALLDDVDALPHLSLRDDQRRREPYGVPVRRFCQQAILGHLKWYKWRFLPHSTQLWVFPSIFLIFS